MHKIPQSWLDKTLARTIDGQTVEIGGQRHTLQVRSTPQGRKSIPNAQYRYPAGHGPEGSKNGRAYQPVGAVDPWPRGQDLARDIGERCAGNSSCVPICLIQAARSPGAEREADVRVSRGGVTARMPTLLAFRPVDPAFKPDCPASQPTDLVLRLDEPAFRLRTPAFEPDDSAFFPTRPASGPSRSAFEPSRSAKRLDHPAS